MRIRAAIVAALSAACLSTLSVFVIAGPAEAVTTNVMKMCADDGYGPTCYTRRYYDSNFHNDDDCDLSCGVYDIDFGDDMSSYRNYTGAWWKFFHDKNYRGYTLCVRPWGYDRNMGDSTNSEDDISSVKRMGKTRPSGCDKVVG